MGPTPKIRLHSRILLAGDRVRSTLIVSRISRFLPGENCMQACIHFNGSMDGLLAMVLINNGEGSGEAHQSVSEIL